MMSLYYAAKSNTDGMGLFASEFIPKGTIWWLCESKIVQGVWMDWQIKRLKWSDYK